MSAPVDLDAVEAALRVLGDYALDGLWPWANETLADAAPGMVAEIGRLRALVERACVVAERRTSAPAGQGLLVGEATAAIAAIRAEAAR